MNQSPEQDTAPAPQLASSHKALQRFALCIAGLSLLFIKPLVGLANYAFHSTLYSHIPLIPCVTFYFLWQNKSRFAGKCAASPRRSFFAFALGLGALAFYWFVYRGSPAFNQNDYLALTVFAFVCFVIGAYLLLLGRNVFSSTGFPMAFLLFIVPFPLALTDLIEAFFQHASAEAAYWMLQLADATVYRAGLDFRLPGITLSVAPECSGIRSTLVLLITSVVAGQLFLRSPWRRAALAFFVIPLAIVRNGLRIFTIAELCMRVGPHMIDSPIHHRGGPVFFLISLVPFFVLLLYLRKKSYRINLRPV